MLYVYTVLSALLIVFGEGFFQIARQSWSWWGVPLIFIGGIVAFLVLHALVLVIYILSVNMKKPIGKSERFFRFMLKISLPLAFKLMKVEVISEGTEKLPEDSRFMLVCNHQHDFDPAIILHELPEASLTFVGKKEIITELPFVAKAMHAIRGLFIDRDNDRQAAKTIISAIKTIKEDKASIALFPEGYTSPDCTLLPFRSGSLKIAYKANVPIVVCVLNNTRSIPKNMFRRKTQVAFKVLDVVYPESFLELHTPQLAEQLHSLINEELKLLRK